MANRTAPAFVSLARTMTLRIATAILVVTLLILGVFYQVASSQQERGAARYANAKAEAVARSLDIFDQTMKLTADNAYSVFRRDFEATFVLDEAAKSVSSYGTPITGTTEVDGFARNFPGANATVFVAEGEDFRRLTTSVLKENGERAIGTLLDRKSAAYPVVRAGKKFVGRVMLFGRPYMTVYEPVLDASGKIVAILYIGLDVGKQQAALGDAVNKTRIFDTGGLYIVNPAADPADATLIFHPSAAGKKLSEVLQAGSADWVKRLAGDDAGWIDNAPAVFDKATEGPHYASVSRSSETGWLVVAEAPASEVLADLYRQMLWLGSFIAIAAL
ncbi:MAG: Cache 3/Cache 2 fusion domain-containing protein, partial [Variovorax sp.]